MKEQPFDSIGLLENNDEELSPSSLRCGPSSYEEMRNWPQEGLDKIEEEWGGRAAISEQLTKFLRVGRISLTTHFSGMGTAELALEVMQRLFRSFLGEGEGVDNIETWSSCDQNVNYQKVLTSHAGICAPKHIFGDIVSQVLMPSRPMFKPSSSPSTKLG